MVRRKRNVAVTVGARFGRRNVKPVWMLDDHENDYEKPKPDAVDKWIEANEKKAKKKRKRKRKRKKKNKP